MQTKFLAIKMDVKHVTGHDCITIYSTFPSPVENFIIGQVLGLTMVGCYRLQNWTIKINFNHITEHDHGDCMMMYSMFPTIENFIINVVLSRFFCWLVYMLFFPFFDGSNIKI